MLEWLAELKRPEKVVWILFSFTCFQLVTKFPNITLIPGERAKVFSGILCLITFIYLLLIKKDSLHLNREWGVCIILALLCICSGIASGEPASPLWRGLTVLSSGIGGFWCGRLLLNTPSQIFLFSKLCLILLTLLLLLGIGGYFLYGNVLHLADIHKHPLNNLILLLSFGPLSLLFRDDRRAKIIGIFFLLVSYYVMSLSFDPIIWFPPLLVVGALLFSNKRRKRTVFFTMLAVFLASTIHLYQVPGRFFNKEDISIWFRVENFFFSTHMALQKPLLGIGLVAPRLEYLEDYKIVYPYVTKEQFAEVIPEINRSSENQFLTFMCDLGFPFVLLYSFSVVMLYTRLLRYLRQGTSIGMIHPVVFWVPITGTLIHLQFYDGLLQPQPCWFFHILLGMISVQNVAPTGQALSPEDEKQGSPAAYV